MRFLPSKTLLLALAIAFVPSLRADDANVTAALAILDQWHEEDPRKETRYLHVVYWHPKDRPPNKDYKGRLKRMMEHIRDFYAAEMKRHGLGPRSFNLKFDKKGELVIHVVEGKGNFADYEKPDGGKVREECLPTLRKAGIDPDRETILLFTNLSDWDPEKNTFKHKSPYYASGSHRQGTAWQLDSPELDTKNIPLKKPIISDGEYGRISLGKHNSIFIGGIAHELGHGLGLPHCRARPDEADRGTALMGAGNRTYADEVRGEGKGTFMTLAHALRLASHPQFSGSAKGMNMPSKAEIKDLELKVEGKGIRVTGRIESHPPVYAIIAYTDPEGGSDYDATTYSAVPDKDGKFTLMCDALKPGKSGALRLFALFVNGAVTGRMSHTPHHFPYNVNADGTPDLSLMETKKALQPLVAALRKNDKERVEAVMKGIAENKKVNEKARQVASRLIGDFLGPKKPPKESPVDVAEGEKRVLLAETKPEKVSVGWGQPVYNHVPDEALLLLSGGELFETGIYAHAPAEHSYDLGGKWKRFTAKAGLAENHRGSVAFVIEADGREIRRTRPTKSGELREFDLDVSGVDVLTLKTDPTRDGPGADWGFWFEPVLTR